MSANDDFGGIPFFAASGVDLAAVQAVEFDLAEVSFEPAAGGASFDTAIRALEQQVMKLCTKIEELENKIVELEVRIGPQRFQQVIQEKEDA